MSIALVPTLAWNPTVSAEWRALVIHIYNKKPREIREDLGSSRTTAPPDHQIVVESTSLKLGHSRVSRGWLVITGEAPRGEGCWGPLTERETDAEFSDQMLLYTIFHPHCEAY